jgi:hypothetical protein
MAGPNLTVHQPIGSVQTISGNTPLTGSTSSFEFTLAVEYNITATYRVTYPMQTLVLSNCTVNQHPDTDIGVSQGTKTAWKAYLRHVSACVV